MTVFRVVSYVDLGEWAETFVASQGIEPSDVQAGVVEVESVFEPMLSDPLIRVSPDGLAVFGV